MLAKNKETSSERRGDLGAAGSPACWQRTRRQAVNDEVISALQRARDAQLQVAGTPRSASQWVNGTAEVVITGRPERVPARRRTFAVAATAAAVVAATLGVSIAVASAHGDTNSGPAIGAAAPSKAAPAAARRSAACDTAMPLPTGTRLHRSSQGTPADQSSPGWNRPGPALWATLARDDAGFTGQMRDFAVAEEQWRLRTGDFGKAVTTPDNLAYLELNYVRGFLTDRTFPAALEPTVAAFAATLAATPADKVQARPNARTGKGCVGTGYTALNQKGGALPAVVFDADGRFLGVDWTAK
jgi:hypothetical protein